jgi:hypothetical protein
VPCQHRVASTPYSLQHLHPLLVTLRTGTCVTDAWRMPMHFSTSLRRASIHGIPTFEHIRHNTTLRGHIGILQYVTNFGYMFSSFVFPFHYHMIYPLVTLTLLHYTYLPSSQLLRTSWSSGLFPLDTYFTYTTHYIAFSGYIHILAI